MKTKLLTLFTLLLLMMNSACGLTFEMYFFTIKCNYGLFSTEIGTPGKTYKYIGLNYLKVTTDFGPLNLKGGNCEVVEVDGEPRTRAEEGDKFNPNFVRDANYVAPEEDNDPTRIFHIDLNDIEDQQILEDMIKELIDNKAIDLPL